MTWNIARVIHCSLLLIIESSVITCHVNWLHDTFRFTVTQLTCVESYNKWSTKCALITICGERKQPESVMKVVAVTLIYWSLSIIILKQGDWKKNKTNAKQWACRVNVFSIKYKCSWVNKKRQKKEKTKTSGKKTNVSHLWWLNSRRKRKMFPL